LALAGISATGASLGVSTSASDTRVGWTVGGGIEWMFTPNWTAKVEYLYMDIGDTTNTAFLTSPTGAVVGANVTSRVTDNIIRGGINYKF
jgi:outer membrane immunogenic protein